MYQKLINQLNLLQESLEKVITQRQFGMSFEVEQEIRRLRNSLNANLMEFNGIPLSEVNVGEIHKLIQRISTDIEITRNFLNPYEQVMRFVDQGTSLQDKFANCFNESMAIINSKPVKKSVKHHSQLAVKGAYQAQQFIGDATPDLTQSFEVFSLDNVLVEFGGDHVFRCPQSQLPDVTFTCMNDSSFLHSMYANSTSLTNAFLKLDLDIKQDITKSTFNVTSGDDRKEGIFEWQRIPIDTILTAGKINIPVFNKKNAFFSGFSNLCSPEPSYNFFSDASFLSGKDCKILGDLPFHLKHTLNYRVETTADKDGHSYAVSTKGKQTAVNTSAVATTGLTTVLGGSVIAIMAAWGIFAYRKSISQKSIDNKLLLDPLVEDKNSQSLEDIQSKITPENRISAEDLVGFQNKI